MIIRESISMFEDPIIKEDIYEKIEKIGRVCYKSEEKACPGSAKKFIRMLMTREHYSVIEHVNLTARFIFDRGVSHELVRHRLASISQESTRFCNYTGSGNIMFVAPKWLNDYVNTYGERMRELLYGEIISLGNVDDVGQKLDGSPKEVARVIRFLNICLESEKYYFDEIIEGYKPEDARGGLVHFVKTELVMTANIREWIHIFDMRNKPAAHPNMREAIGYLYNEFVKEFPEIAELTISAKNDAMAKEIESVIDECSALRPELINKLKQAVTYLRR